jgi:signal transduction histidine kinase
VGLLRSVRGRLLLITVLPMIGLLVLTGLQARSSANVVGDAGRALTLAATSTATMELLHQLGREQAETVALRDRGGKSGEVLVTAQQARTDDALVAFNAVISAAISAAPGLRSALDAATSELASLGKVRDAGSPSAGAAAGVDVPALYAPATAVLLAVADAVPAQLVDRELANRARAVAALAAAKHALAEERDVLSTAFRRHAFAAGELTKLVTLATTEQERLASFHRVAAASALATYEHLVTGPDVETTTRLRDAAVAGTGGSLAVDSDAWYVAATNTIRWLHEVELALADDMSGLAARARGNALRDAMATVIGAASLAIVAAAIAAAVAARTSRRLGRLRSAALASAQRLPDVVGEIAVAHDAVRVHDAHLVAAHRTKGELARESRDEIGQVGAAFGLVHATALGLAADQALLRLDTEALVVALARRSQKLVQRQLGSIDELERHETDPDTLAKYYLIDHLAARMRRNDENLLVLAGVEPGRRFTGAFPLLDVVRAASAEIAEYQRVETAAVPWVAVAGRAVGDLVHLLAELLENAASFSPPQTRVSVSARHTLGGLQIAIYDNGIGMAPDYLAAVNLRLAQPTMLTSALAGTLGLLVVARLAARHGISVELLSRDGAGTVALVNLPSEILAEVQKPAGPLTTPPWPQGVAEAIGQGSSGRASVRSHTACGASPTNDEMMSAWFAGGSTSAGHRVSEAEWGSPGDAEHARVQRVLAEPASHVGGGLPRRRHGAHLLPGAVPDGRQETRHPVDPERVRSQLSSLSQGLAAAARTPHASNHHIGRTP